LGGGRPSCSTTRLGGRGSRTAAAFSRRLKAAQERQAVDDSLTLFPMFIRTMVLVVAFARYSRLHAAIPEEVLA
jgi:hypothetical protein